MQTKNNIEEVYELLEQYEFAELSENDRLKVLSFMTESQYADMRRTINNVKHVLEDDIDPEINAPVYSRQYKEGKIIRFFNYQLKVYQVAAGFAILISSLFLFQYMNKDHANQLIAKNETVTIRQVDTVHTIIFDTIKIIKENVRNIQPGFSLYIKDDLVLKPLKEVDCSNNLCPGEIENLVAMNSKNTISNDSAIKELLLSLN